MCESRKMSLLGRVISIIESDDDGKELNQLRALIAADKKSVEEFNLDLFGADESDLLLIKKRAPEFFNL